MLKNMVRTPEETESYLAELEEWLESNKNIPCESISDFFSRNVEMYDGFHLENWQEEYAQIADFFDDDLRTLLDIGAGTGLELDAIFKRFPRVETTCIDLSRDMLGKLLEKYDGKNVKIVNADYFEYPFGVNAFDAALSFETLHHFRAEKKLKIFRKLYAALKPGGCYVECDYTACSEKEEELCLKYYEMKRKQYGVNEDVFIHFDIPLTPEHEKELILSAGFKSVEMPYRNLGTVILKAVK